MRELLRTVEQSPALPIECLHYAPAVENHPQDRFAFGHHGLTLDMRRERSEGQSSLSKGRAGEVI